MLRKTFVSIVLVLLTSPVTADESPSRLDDAKASLAQLAAWFDSLPPEERAEAARELRRWLAQTYGTELPFPFSLPSEEEITSWEGEPAGETPAVPAGDAASEAIAEVTHAAVDEESSSSAEGESSSGAEPAVRPKASSSEAPLPRTPLPKTPQPASRCNTLVPFDTDGDGALGGLDRYWRHLYLWFDSDGDRTPSDGEMMSPFEYKIREISLDLRYFVAGKGKKAGRGEIETDDYILFDTDLDGFSATLFPAGDDAALAVDADALRRDPKGVDIRDAEGAEVTGIQPFARGWAITSRDGATVAIDCPG